VGAQFTELTFSSSSSSSSSFPSYPTFPSLLRQLSVTEENFLVPPVLLTHPHPSTPQFNFQAFVPLALRLMELDPNLARMHSKLMPSMEEEGG